MSLGHLRLICQGRVGIYPTPHLCPRRATRRDWARMREKMLTRGVRVAKRAAGGRCGCRRSPAPASTARPCRGRDGTGREAVRPPRTSVWSLSGPLQAAGPGVRFVQQHMQRPRPNSPLHLPFSLPLFSPNQHLSSPAWSHTNTGKRNLGSQASGKTTDLKGGNPEKFQTGDSHSSLPGLLVLWGHRTPTAAALGTSGALGWWGGQAGSREPPRHPGQPCTLHLGLAAPRTQSHHPETPDSSPAPQEGKRHL